MNHQRNSFHKAVESILKNYGRSPIAHFVAENIIKAHKFVIPDAGKMTEGKAFADMADCMRLPFERVALLRELEIDGLAYQQICLGVASRLVIPSGNTSCDFFVADCVCLPESGGEKWGPSRPIGIEVGLIGGGVRMHEIDEAVEQEIEMYGGDQTPEDMTHEDGFGALNALTELMVMLSLENVTTAVVVGPEKLNRKRAASGKLPLYDYHVLLIDGKETSRGDRSDGSDQTVRSHFRRGHIRRLDENRRVWVRQAYVHGRADGFVDKDYLVKRARLAQ